MKIVAISDTHCALSKITLPKGDILIFAGDLTYRGTIPEIQNELDMLDDLGTDFKYRILIPGNHDWLAEHNESLFKQMCQARDIIYLNNTGIELDGIKFWGSGVTPEFGSWALNVPRGEKIKAYWDMIPEDTQVLITHGPPAKILDLCPDGRHAGCDDLLIRIKQLKDLKAHFFGHIHGQSGIQKHDGVTFINASILDDYYKLKFTPKEIII